MVESARARDRVRRLAFLRERRGTEYRKRSAEEERPSPADRLADHWHGETGEHSGERYCGHLHAEGETMAAKRNLASDQNLCRSSGEGVTARRDDQEDHKIRERVSECGDTKETQQTHGHRGEKCPSGSYPIGKLAGVDRAGALHVWRVESGGGVCGG